MIIIPMAGNSSRFFKAGYTRPKYELPVGQESLFALCVRSFEAYFKTERFVFVCRSDMGAQAFVTDECTRLGVRDFDCVVLESPTRGQAETVLLGLQRCAVANAEAVLIFNIDTARPGYRFPSALDLADGYLEVFAGEGDHWSFVLPAASFSARAAATTEKQRVSSLCCTGLYYFARADVLMQLCVDAIADIDNYCQLWGELYVAPLYNELIASGAVITYHEVPIASVVFSGTPDEYAALLQSRGLDTDMPSRTAPA